MQTASPPFKEAAEPTQGGRAPWLKRAAVWAVSISALAFVVKVVPFRDQCTTAGCEPGLFTTFRAAAPEALVPLFGLYLLGTFLWAARWRALLGLAGIRLPLWRVWAVTLQAQAGGILLPGGIGG